MMVDKRGSTAVMFRELDEPGLPFMVKIKAILKKAPET
jgi:hypothetical protein